MSKKSLDAETNDQKMIRESEFRENASKWKCAQINWDNEILGSS